MGGRGSRPAFVGLSDNFGISVFGYYWTSKVWFCSIKTAGRLLWQTVRWKPGPNSRSSGGTVVVCQCDCSRDNVGLIHDQFAGKPANIVVRRPGRPSLKQSTQSHGGITQTAGYLYMTTCTWFIRTCTCTGGAFMTFAFVDCLFNHRWPVGTNPTVFYIFCQIPSESTFTFNVDTHWIIIN